MKKISVLFLGLSFFTSVFATAKKELFSIWIGEHNQKLDLTHCTLLEDPTIGETVLDGLIPYVCEVTFSDQNIPCVTNLYFGLNEDRASRLNEDKQSFGAFYVDCKFDLCDDNPETCGQKKYGER